MKIINLLSLLCLVLFISCSKEERKEISNQVSQESLEERSPAVLRAAIANVFSKTSVINAVTANCITNVGETILVSQISSLVGVSGSDISTISSAGITQFYFPFVDFNLSNRTSINIVNLDGQTDSLNVYDLDGTIKSRTVMASNFTIMFKTQTHVYDSALIGSGSGGWRPWRKCYCMPIKSEGGGTSSLAECIVDDNKGIGGYGRCGRSGFISQECGGSCQ